MVKQPQIDYRKLSLALAQQMKNGGSREKDFPSSTPTTVYAHGGTSQGLFSTLGLSRNVFSALSLPRAGLIEQLNWYPTNEMNPLFPSITGVSEDTGSEPNGVCDDPPTAGLLYSCTQSYPMGRYSRQTRVFDIDRVGKIQRRGEFTDLRFIGNPPNNSLEPTGVMPASNSDVMNTEAGKALFELGVSWQRKLGRQVFIGDPANNSAGNGYREMRGMDLVLNTGHVDAVNLTTLCTTIDSYVRDFGSVDMASNPNLYVKNLIYAIRNIQARASNMGLAPVTLGLVMRWSAFWELTEIYPQNFATYRNVVGLGDTAAATVMYDGFRVNDLRASMRGDMFARTGQYLLVDGMRIPVIIDDGIIETQSEGTYTSDIYIVPFTVLNGIEVTYAEYIDYNQVNGAMDFARQFALQGFFDTSDNGRFLWHKKPPQNFCVQWLAKIEPRIVCLTPQFGGRLTNASYTPFQHEDSPWTDEYDFQGYGGVYERS